MDAVSRRGPSVPDPRIRAFRAADAFVIESYRVAAVFEGGAGRDLARDLRRTVARCGASLVAAAAVDPGDPDERGSLHEARLALARGRYYLYLARRFGLIDVRRYRGVIARQDAAARELDGVLKNGSRSGHGSRDPT